MRVKVSRRALDGNRFERIKHEKDGLDVRRDIYRYARGQSAIPAEDLDRMKWYGLFYRARAAGTFMLRVRVPNGILDVEQLRAVAGIAEEYGRGRADLTTRQGIQVRWLRIEDVPDVFDRLHEVGLSPLQTGMDNVRNVVGCPLAGLDADEALDASGLVRDLTEAILTGKKAYSNLPRKFNVSITGCREDCGHADIQDIGLTPAELGGEVGGAVGFNVAVGGALGGPYQVLSRPLNAFVRPEEAVEVCLRIVEIFRDHGPREQRTRARLAFLLEDWGLERFRGELERRLDRRLPPAGRPLERERRGDHLGVHRQKQPGLCYVGLHVPVGRTTAGQLRELCRLAETYGSGEIRLTADQNIILPNVPEESVPALLREDLLRAFRVDPGPLARRLVCCTGVEEFCNFAVIPTKGTALALVEELERRLGPGAPPLRIHMSGCPNSCGQHHIGHIGLEGAKARVDGRLVDAANVYRGGRYGPGGRCGEKVLERVPLDQLADVLEGMIRKAGVAEWTDTYGVPAESVKAAEGWAGGACS